MTTTHPRRLEGARALVTGAARGIGAAIAGGLAAEGAAVAVADLDGAGAEAVAVAIRAAGGAAVAIPVDVADAASVSAAFAAMDAALGGIDVLVNNAGILQRRDFLDITEDDWDRSHRVNSLGALRCTQEAARRFIAAGVPGRIVNICSTSSRQPSADFAVYASTKAALLSLTQASAKAFAGHGIRVNGIAPGIVDTALWRDDPAALADRALEDYLGQIPLGRLATPEDVVAPVVFLASDDAAYITGQLIQVDGGMIML